MGQRGAGQRGCGSVKRHLRLALVLAVVLGGVLVLVAPAAAEETGIVAIGDFGRGGEPQRKLGAAVRRFVKDTPVALLLTLGDNDSTGDPSSFRATERAAGDVGYRGPSYEGARQSPTSSRPESKLWWNDGSWWGSLFDASSGDYHIFRLDESSQRWEDTRVTIDRRVASRADTLWDGRHLYVASHVASPVSNPGRPSLLFRFSYDRGTGLYVLDEGYPTRINGVSSTALVIDKDSTGTIWATWVEQGRVMVNRTVHGDRSWGAPFVLPAENIAVGDDLSSIVAFGGNRIGVFWGNHLTGFFQFAVHVDGELPDRWGPTETIQGLGSANDHVNVKADSTGRVYAAVKTSEQTPSDTLVALLVREPESGAWVTHAVSTVFENVTRPVCVIDEVQRVAFVFMTHPVDDVHLGGIQVKAAPLDSLLFEPGPGITVIRDARALDTTDVTSTKQAVTPETGLVVLASNNTTRRYWHAYTSLATSPLVVASKPEPSGDRTSIGGSAGRSDETVRRVLSKAASALFVAFGLPLWLLVVAAIGASGRLAVWGVSGIVVVACAGVLTVGVASAVL